MKQFLKITLAVIVGCLITGGIFTFVFFGAVGSLAALGKSQPIMPRSAVLRIDLSAVQLGEQTREMDLLSAVSKDQVSVIGILDATRAIEAAAADPAIKYIYLKPDMVYGGMAEIEELRRALADFRMSGKAVISYIENPSNAGYYLASVSDRIYMTPHAGGMNMLTGISSQMVFVKDILDRLGVNVQLIRHGKYKSAGETFVRSEASRDNLVQNRELIASIWGDWCADIAESRDITVGEFNSAIDNLELNMPEDFLDAGLVDELLTLDELETKLEGYFNAGEGFPHGGVQGVDGQRPCVVVRGAEVDDEDGGFVTCARLPNRSDSTKLSPECANTFMHSKRAVATNSFFIKMKN